jgi:hypothetical protein
MRLPGFFHRKAAPFMVRIVEVNDDAPAYSVSDFEEHDAAEDLAQEDTNRGATGDAADETISPWASLNTLAPANLGKWVPALFGDAAVYQRGTGSYRVSSEALGRDCEEDLSIHPDGIKDFGVHDVGDACEGKRTPIDIVMKYGRKDFSEAIHWLKERLEPEIKDAGSSRQLDLSIRRR